MEVFKLATIFILVTSNFALGWKYPEDVGDGWAAACPEGKEQSPIDIRNEDLTEITNHADYEPFIFHGYDIDPKKASVVNNGHSVKLTLTKQPKAKYPAVTRGGLPGKYKFGQLHFHWGSTGGQGSEHTINGKRYPMEVHLVHFKMEYHENDIGKAIGNGAKAKKRDQLAVLGTMFEIQDEDNQDLTSFIDTLKKCKKADPDKKIAMNEPFPMVKLLPRNTDRFYRYNGSLTTPNCNEVVVWTVFKESIGVSESQLNEFRSIFVGADASSGMMTDNFRGVQPLNGRTVYDVDTSKKLFNKASSLSSEVNFAFAIIMSLMTYCFV